MALTLELPSPIDAELALEAQREGVSETERAALFICLATALTSDEKPTPFQDAVKLFLSHHALDATRVASVMEELVKVCLDLHDVGKTSHDFQQSINNTATPENYTLLKQWRNAFVHGVTEKPLDVQSEVLSVSTPPINTQIQVAGRTNREAVPGNGDATHPQRDPDLVARVRATRGKYAHTAQEPGTEELHRERQRDKAKEEAQIRGDQS